VIRHGGAKHGNTEKLYYVWNGMRMRCLSVKNKAYKDYGGRGIGICADWETYPAFKSWALGSGYVEGLSLDRIDNDGN